MFTNLGSKSLAANNYRINEDPENNSHGYCCKSMHVNILKCMHAKCDSRQWCASECIQVYHQCSLTGHEGLKCDGGLAFLCQSLDSIHSGPWSILVDTIQTLKTSIYHIQYKLH